MSNKAHRNALPAGYELHWYRIEKILGQGGFGLTYLAQDINLERPVAIKEYMPAQICVREEDQSIHPLSAEVEEDYTWGLKRFISEARTLTKFEHPSLVRIFNVFESNNSAYMVMNYELGKSLKEILKSGMVFSEDELIKVLFPLMDGLETVHKQGFVHRDIKPGNIFLRVGGGPVLLDFGSARQTRGELGTMTVTNFVSPGYAPIEQYSGKSDRQGPWTDIYGLGATAYEAITGEMPEASIDRSVMISDEAGDNLIAASQLAKGRFSQKFLAAIDHALAFNIQERPQSIAEWREEFGVGRSKMETLKVTQETQEQTVVLDPATEKIDTRTQALTRKTDSPADIAESEATFSRTDILVAAETQKIRPRYRSFLIGIAVVAVIAVLVMGYHTYLRMLLLGEPEISTAVAEPEAPEAEIPVAVVETEVIEEEPEPAGPTVEEQIQELIMAAREDIEALRLTTPVNNNAYDKLQNALALDGNNTQALRGIELISDKYIQLVYTDIETQNFERARNYLVKANEVTPGAAKVRNARSALEVAVKEEQRRRTVFGRIRRFLGNE